MIDVTIEDVVVRTEGQEAGDIRVVLLKEADGERRVPIWVGAPEAAALVLHLGGEAMPRPMTADLLAKVISATGAAVERVEINALREETFYATVFLATDSGTKEVDARPSDALNLALRVDAPILVTDELMDASGMPGGIERLDEEIERRGPDPVPAGEWRSLTPELVKSMLPPWPKRK